MELISKVHMQLLQRRASVQLDDGSTIPYPASDSVVLLEGDQDLLTFHLLHKDLDTTHMTPLMVMDEYTSIIAWTMGRPSGQTACLQLTTACKFSHELQMMMCEGAKGALQVLRDSILEQRTYTVSESRSAVDSSGNTVQLEPGTNVRFTTDYSNAACAGCYAPFPAGFMPMRCTVCMLNALYCGKACQRLHWKLHKEACKPEAMLFMRTYVGTRPHSRVPPPHDGPAVVIACNTEGCSRVPPLQDGPAVVIACDTEGCIPACTHKCMCPCKTDLRWVHGVCC